MCYSAAHALCDGEQGAYDGYMHVTSVMLLYASPNNGANMQGPYSVWDMIWQCPTATRSLCCCMVLAFPPETLLCLVVVSGSDTAAST